MMAIKANIPPVLVTQVIKCDNIQGDQRHLDYTSGEPSNKKGSND